MPTSSACTIKSLASRGNPSFSARDLALFCVDTAWGLPRMKRSRKSESETVFIFIKRPEQLHVRITMILPTLPEDSYCAFAVFYTKLCFKARTQFPINVLLVNVNHASQRPRCTKLEALFGAHCGLQVVRGSRLRSYEM